MFACIQRKSSQTPIYPIAWEGGGVHSITFQDTVLKCILPGVALGGQMYYCTKR